MRSSVLALWSAGMLALAGTATSANAASIVSGVTPASLSPPSSAMFGAVVSGTVGASTPIDDTFLFSIVDGPGVTNAQVSTMLLNGNQNIDFKSITLDGLYAFAKTSSDPGPETWAIDPVTLGNGGHWIEVIGTLSGPTGSYSGTINVQAPVPEAKTWTMMLLGFGVIGLSIGRRRRPVLAKIA